MNNSFSNRLFLVSIYVLMSMAAIICLYPFYYVIIFSISNQANSYGKVFFIPVSFDISTYKAIFKIKDIGNAAIISVLRTVVGALVTVMCNGLFAYLLSKKNMPGRKLIYRILIITMYFNAGLIPWYMTMRSLGLKDNFLLYILPYTINAFFVIIMKTYFENLPPDIEESAMVDGAGIMTIYFKIVVSISKPIFATVAVFAAVNQWNAWMDTYFLVSNRSSLKTLQLLLYNYIQESTRLSQMTSAEMSLPKTYYVITPESVRTAVTVVVILPILMVYPFLQKYFLKGIMLGAMKG